VATFGFCCGTFQLLKKWKAEALAEGRPVPSAYCDDHAEAWRGDICGFRPVLQRLGADYLQKGMRISQRKLIFLPPPGHLVSESEREFVEEEVGGRIAVGGVVLAGKPIGTEAFVRSHLLGLLDYDENKGGLFTFLRHLTNMARGDQQQSALLLIRKCLASRFIHLARSVEPTPFREEIGTRVDAVSLWMLEQVAGMSMTAAEMATFLRAPSIEQIRLLPHQQHQAFVPESQGGLGMMRLAAAADPAFLGSMLAKYRIVLSPTELLPVQVNDEIFLALVDGSGEKARRDAIAGEVLKHGNVSGLEELLPDGWMLGGAPGPPLLAVGVAGLETRAQKVERGRALAVILSAGEAKGKSQGKLMRLGRKEERKKMVEAIETLPMQSAVAEVRGCETRQRAKARTLSQNQSGTMAWLNALPVAAELMCGAVTTTTLQRVLGLCVSRGSTTSTMEVCPHHGLLTAAGNVRANAVQVYRCTSHHAPDCIHAGNHTSQHNGLARGTGGAVRESGVTGVRVERQDCFDGPRAMGRVLQMDMTFSPFSIQCDNPRRSGGQMLLLDFSIASAVCQTAIRNLHSDTVVGAAGIARENAKIAKYAETTLPATSDFVPCVMESTGRMMPRFLGVLEDLATHKARLVVDASRRSVVRGQHLARLRLLLSVALQSAVSVSELQYQHNVRLSVVEGAVRRGGLLGNAGWLRGRRG
jgi:nitrite reductase/ring-hydroxylating ferredoxin subunit